MHENTSTNSEVISEMDSGDLNDPLVISTGNTGNTGKTSNMGNTGNTGNMGGGGPESM